MAYGDIHRIFVSYEENDIYGKERYTVEILPQHELNVYLNSITSKYENKSEHIQSQYYFIKDWQQAGLKKGSYIDILAVRKYDILDMMKHAKHTGTLSEADKIGLSLFIKEYNEKLLISK